MYHAREIRVCSRERGRTFSINAGIYMLVDESRFIAMRPSEMEDEKEKLTKEKLNERERDERARPTVSAQTHESEHRGI